MKNRSQKEKKLLKIKNKKNKKKVKKTEPFIPSIKTTQNVSNGNNLCSVMEECDIDVIASQIKQKGESKKFPDITRD